MMEFGMATPVVNAIKVNAYPQPFEGNYWLEIHLPTNDYDGYKSLPDAVEYKGRVYGKSSFNTDRCYAAYSTGVIVARKR